MKAGQLAAMFDSLDPNLDVMVKVTRDVLEDPDMPLPLSGALLDFQRIETTTTPMIGASGRPAAFTRCVVRLQP